jgi:hypothetical protein
MWTAVLFIHITSGTLALLAGPAAMLLPIARRAYRAAVNPVPTGAVLTTAAPRPGR